MKSNFLLLVVIILASVSSSFVTSKFYKQKLDAKDNLIVQYQNKMKDMVTIQHMEIGDFIFQGNKMYGVYQVKKKDFEG